MSSEWQSHALRDLVTIRHGFAFKGEFFSDTHSSLQLVTPGNFAIGGGFQLGKGKYYAGPVPEDYVLKSGDLIVTMTDLSKNADTLGYAAKVPTTSGTTWLHNQRVGLIRAKNEDRIDMGYMHYLMRSPSYRQLVVSTATGSTVKHTSPDRILAFEFELPPIDEQKSIAGLLTTLDDRITLLRETNTLLEQIAQTIFKSWFVDFDPVRAKQEGRMPEGMDEETAALFPDSFEESELGMVPRGWRVGELQDLLVLQRGFDLPAADRQPGPFPIIAASGPSGTHEAAMAKGPGVITGRSGVLGRVFMELDDYWPLNTSLWVKEFRVATPCFAYELLKQMDLSSFNSGSAVPTLNRNHIHVLGTLIPASSCVAAYEAIALDLHRRVRANTEQAGILADLRDTLLPRLISGKLRLPEAEAMLSSTNAASPEPVN